MWEPGTSADVFTINDFSFGTPICFEDTFGYKIIYAKDGKLPEYMIFVGGLLYDKK